MNKYDIYGIGAALVDTEITVDDDFLSRVNLPKGMMSLGDEARQREIIDALGEGFKDAERTSGGSAANSVIASRNYGASVHLCCRTADDDDGDLYRKALNTAGVDCNNAVNGGSTGRCLVLITPDAQRTMCTFLGVSSNLCLDDIDSRHLQNSEFVYMEGYLVIQDRGLEAAIDACKQARAASVKTALSFSDPSVTTGFRDRLNDVIGDGVDLIFCNEEEAVTWSQTERLQDSYAPLRAVAKQVVITLGADGALILDAERPEPIRIAPYPTKAIDTNGAGDMFAGAYLYGITHGMSAERAGALASMSASALVSHFGPRMDVDKQQALLKNFNTARKIS